MTSAQAQRLIWESFQALRNDRVSVADAAASAVKIQGLGPWFAARAAMALLTWAAPDASRVTFPDISADPAE